MTERRFHQLSLALPIVVPLLLAPLLPLLNGPILSIVFFAAGILVFASVVAGIPYLICAGIALWLVRGRSAATWQRFLAVAPLLFAVVVAVLAIAIDLFTDGGDPFDAARLLGGFTLGVGYFYVALAFGLRKLLTWRGAIRSA